MTKQDEYKIGGNATEFVNKHRPTLPPIMKAELVAMLREFAINQVKDNVALGNVSKCDFCGSDDLVKGKTHCKKCSVLRIY